MTQVAGRTVAAPATQGEQVAGDPSRQPRPGDTPPPVSDDDAAGIPEEDRQRILASFKGGIDPGDPPEDDPPEDDPPEDDPPEDDPPEDDPPEDDQPKPKEGDGDEDLLDDEAVLDGAETAGEGGESEEVEEDAEELDKVQKDLVGKSADSFAKMRIQIKDLRKALKVSEAQAEYGRRMSAFVDRFGLQDQQLYEGMNLVATIETDPIRAIGLLRQQLSRTASLVRERYPDVDIDGMLTFTPDTVAKAGEDDLPADLREMVDEGRLTEERAKEISAALKRKEGGGDAPTPATAEAIAMTNNALRQLGFYQVKSEQELQQRIDLLVPAMSRLAERLGLDMKRLSPQARKELAVRAAKVVLQKLNGKPRKAPTSGSVLRSREAGRLRQSVPGDHQNWADVRKAVAAQFSSKA